MQGKQFVHAIGLAVAGLAAGAAVAQAQLTSADVVVNPTFVQSGPSTVAPAGGFFSARAFFTNPNDFEAGQLFYGGPGSPADLTLGFSPPSLTSAGSNSFLSAPLSDFPSGLYWRRHRATMTVMPIPTRRSSRRLHLAPFRV
jgi:hypothetical protein